MAAAYLYAFLTFSSGSILLLGWVYITADNPRSGRLLLKSAGLFVVPNFAIAAFPLAPWLLILFEEALKATAAKTEREPMNRFWLVALFGLWELLLAKTLLGIGQADVLAGATRLESFGLAAVSLMTVLMHTITAEIYAFRFRGQILGALAASWALHTAYNESVDLLGISVASSLLLLLPLALLVVGLWPRRCIGTQDR